MPSSTMTAYRDPSGLRSFPQRLSACLFLCLLLSAQTALAADWVLSCAPNNDLYQVLTANQHPCSRYDTPAQAIENAAPNTGVLILADAYPQKRTQLPDELLAQARQKNLRLYIEYPQSLPHLEFADPRYIKCGTYGSVLERTVVASDFFGPALPKMRILVINDCTVLPVQAPSPHLVLARVVGYDHAALGLPADTTPVLFEHPQGDILVATTKLSHFVKARYAPTVAWEPGEAVADSRLLTISLETAPGVYDVQLAVYYQVEGELVHLPVISRQGEMLSNHIALTRVRVLP